MENLSSDNHAKVSYDTKIPYDAVVLSGGGTKLLYTLGALHYYHERGTLKYDYIKGFAGTSAGALTVTLMNLGMSPWEIFKIVYDTDNIFSIWDLNNFSVLRQKLGFMSLQVLIDRFMAIVLKKLNEPPSSPNILNSSPVDKSQDTSSLPPIMTVTPVVGVPTLKQLKESTNKELYIGITNEDLSEAEYFDAETKPDWSIVTTGCVSCSLPIIFEKYIGEDGVCYTDGGLSNNFPIRKVSLDLGDEVPPRKILGIIVEDKLPHTDTSVLDYLNKIISIPIRNLTQLRSKEVRPQDDVTILTIECDANILGIGLTKADKLGMFRKGFNVALRHDGT